MTPVLFVGLSCCIDRAKCTKTKVVNNTTVSCGRHDVIEKFSKDETRNVRNQNFIGGATSHQDMP